MRDALTIFDQTVAFCGTEVKYEDVLKNLNVLDYDHCFNLVNAFLSGDHVSALLRFDDILSKGFNALHFIGSLSSHLRDLIVAKSNGLKALLELPDTLIDSYKEQASRCSLKFLYDALAITTACEAGYKASINPRLHIEFCLMRLCALSGGLKDASEATAVATPASAAKAPATAPVAAPAPSVISTGGEAVAEKSPSAPAPTVAPSPRKHVAKTPGALSLAALKKQDSEQEATVTADASAEGVIPSDELITEKWKELAEKYSDRPRLYTTLSGSSLQITEEEGRKRVVFFVTNKAQMDWIREKLLKDLDGNLRKLLGTGRILLDIDVTPDEEQPQKSYTPREQAQELIHANPEIRNLVTDMGLDA